LKYSVDVEITVEVEVDESKFTEEFMEGFRQNFYPFTNIYQHVGHLAQLYARGIVNEFETFIEGYGPPGDFGIKFKALGQNVSV